jgi:hypothetical protein
VHRTPKSFSRHRTHPTDTFSSELKDQAAAVPAKDEYLTSHTDRCWFLRGLELNAGPDLLNVGILMRSSLPKEIGMGCLVSKAGRKIAQSVETMIHRYNSTSYEKRRDADSPSKSQLEQRPSHVTRHVPSHVGD